MAATARQTDVEKLTPLLHSIFKGDLGAVTKTLPLHKKPGAERAEVRRLASTVVQDTTLLSTAAMFNQTTIVAHLLSIDADLNTKEKYGGTALTAAAENGHVDVVRWLIEAKADMNSQDDGGMTALMRAAWKDHPTCVELLVSSGADLTLQTPSGHGLNHYVGPNVRVKDAITRASQALATRRAQLATALGVILIHMPTVLLELVAVYAL